LPFLFSFEEFGLELATGTLVLNLIDQRLDLLRLQKRIRSKDALDGARRRRGIAEGARLTSTSLAFPLITCMLARVRLLQADVCESMRAVDGSESKLLLGHVVWMLQLSFDSHLADAEAVHGRLLVMTSIGEDLLVWRSSLALRIHLSVSLHLGWILQLLLAVLAWLQGPNGWHESYLLIVPALIVDWVEHAEGVGLACRDVGIVSSSLFELTWHCLSVQGFLTLSG